MVEANFPINESGPSVLIISVATPKDAVPEIGLVKANGTISGGTFKMIEPEQLMKQMHPWHLML